MSTRSKYLIYLGFNLGFRCMQVYAAFGSKLPSRKYLGSSNSQVSRWFACSFIDSKSTFAGQSSLNIIMLFCAPSRAFAVLCLLAGLLVITASPVPGAIAGTATVANHERRAGPKKGKGTPVTPPTNQITVPIDLWIHKGSPDDPFHQHWALVINKVNGFHATLQGDPENEPLITAKFPYMEAQAHKLTPLNCQATFKNPSTMNNAFKELLNLKFTKPPSAEGNNCMDYVKSALTYLASKKYIEKVPDAFTTIYNRDYKKVGAAVYPEHGKKR